MLPPLAISTTTLLGSLLRCHGQGQECQQRRSPLVADVFLISDRLFIMRTCFRLTVVHLHPEQRECRGKVRPRKAVGCQRARSVQWVLPPVMSVLPSATSDLGPLTASTKKVNTPEKTQMTLRQRKAVSILSIHDTCINRKGETHPVPKRPEKTMGTRVQQVVSYYYVATSMRHAAYLSSAPASPRAISKTTPTKLLFSLLTQEYVVHPNPAWCRGQYIVQSLKKKMQRYSYQITKWEPQRPQLL